MGAERLVGWQDSLRLGLIRHQIVFLIVVATSIWVLFDARSSGIRKGLVKGLADLGPWGWFFACLFLWIVAFPVYLAKRTELKRAAASSRDAESTGARSSAMAASEIEQLERLAALRQKGALTDEEFAAKKREILKMPT